MNYIEICEVGMTELNNSVSYELFCSRCKQFITNKKGFNDLISKLLGLLHISIAMCAIVCNVPSNSNLTSHTYVDIVPAKLKKIIEDVDAQNDEVVTCNALDSTMKELSMKALELINILKFNKLTHQLL